MEYGWKIVKVTRVNNGFVAVLGIYGDASLSFDGRVFPGAQVGDVWAALNSKEPPFAFGKVEHSKLLERNGCPVTQST